MAPARILTKVRNRLRRYARAVMCAMLPSARLQRTVPENPKIALAVLAHERPEYLELCLEALFQTHLCGYDITFFIVDDGSIDPRVREIIERPRPAAYKIIRVFTPKGPNSWGAAFNKAMRLMLAHDAFDILGTCDSDALFHPDWLDRTLRIALWAKANHRAHILGPFSSFNSSNGDFHEILGAYDTPFGRYLVKRRMGAVNYLYFREDFLKLGFFPENRDDETQMTERFEMLKVRNFCTETTYVEHMGELSLLNTWRPVEVYRPAFGLALPTEGWPDALARAATVGYCRDVQPVRTVGAVESPLPLDVLIHATADDVPLLPQTIEGIRRHLRHPLGAIRVVGPDLSSLQGACAAVACAFTAEAEILPFSGESAARCPAWLRREIVRLSGEALAETGHYLVLRAGTILLRQQTFAAGKTPLLLLDTDAFHDPQHDVFTAVTGLPSFRAFDTRSDWMLVAVERLRAFKALLEARHGKPWWQVLVDYAVVEGLDRYPECELYCQWSLARFAGDTIWEYPFQVPRDRRAIAGNDALEAEYGGDYRFVAFTETASLPEKIPYLQDPTIRPRLADVRLAVPGVPRRVGETDDEPKPERRLGASR